MSDVTVTPMGPHQFGVEITEGDTTTSHEVTVPEELLDDLGLVDVDEERVVRESIAFLLEREPATSIMQQFSLDVISQYFPEYGEELSRRLS